MALAQIATTMEHKLNYRWRQAATGICFSFFGIGGLAIGLLMTPIALTLGKAYPAKTEAFAKAIIHYSFRVFIELMRGLRVLSYNVEGIEKLAEPGQIIIANHPTLIDVVFLIGLTPKADCVVKSHLLKNPFTWGPITASGYITNDTPEAVITAARKSLDKGNNLIIFPEGTRSTPGQPLRLQRGAANIAIRTANKLRPVIIKCAPSTLTKGTKWHDIPERKPHISFSARDSLDITPYLDGSPPLKSRELTQAIAAYFNRENTINERA